MVRLHTVEAIAGACAILSLAFLITACDGGSTPSTPTSPGPPVTVSAPPPAVPLTLSGYVGDTAYRVLPSVTVEVIEGPDTGKVMTSDAQGRFSYTGMFTARVLLRASKDGYAIATEPARVLTTGAAYVSFQMASLSPPVTIAGNYTLTITADPACTSLPEDVRVRSFAAAVTPDASARTPNTKFTGRISQGQFAPFANLFWIGVAADFVTVTTEGEGPSIVEQVGTNRYIAFAGSVGVTVDSPEVSTISAPFRGVIEYCQLKGPVGQYYECLPELAEVREQCMLQGSRLTLERR